MLNDDISKTNVPNKEVKIEELHKLSVVVEQETKQEPQTVYKCSACSKIYNSKKNLNNHNYRMHNTTAKLPCGLCGKYVKSTSELKIHLVMHSDERNFKCDQCDKSFKMKNVLLKHKKAVHATERPFQCKVCPKGFATAFFLKRHSIKHSVVRPHKCDQCSEAFKERGCLNKHMVNVHGKGGKFACDVCGKFFMSLTTFTDHLARHNDERTHVCDQCGTSFKVVRDLVKHKRNVHSDKSFQCDACPKRFTSSEYLQSHALRKHTTERPYECELCCKTFKVKNDLHKHKLWKHVENGKFCCHVCEKSFPLLAAFKIHVLMHSDERTFKCDQCGKAYRTNSCLTVHKSLVHATERPFQCEKCPKSFAMAHFLKVHSRKHEEKQLKRRKRRKALTNPTKSKRELEKRDRNSSHLCEECGDSFKSRSDLDKHFEEAHRAETFHDVDVKVEPVLLYDSEEIVAVPDEIKVEMNLEIKQEPQDDSGR